MRGVAQSDLVSAFALAKGFEFGTGNAGTEDRLEKAGAQHFDRENEGAERELVCGLRELVQDLAPVVLPPLTRNSSR